MPKFDTWSILNKWMESLGDIGLSEGVDVVL